MKNESGLKPLGRAVLVQPYEPDLKGGMIEIPDFVKAKQQSIEQRAIVIEAGPSAWDGEPVPRAKPGDKVLLSGFAGYMATGTADNKQYRFVNDRDIFAQIEVENNGSE